MKKTSITGVKSNLSRYLARVRRGGTVLVFHRGHPVAQFVPLPHGPRDGRAAPNGWRGASAGDSSAVAQATCLIGSVGESYPAGAAAFSANCSVNERRAAE